MRINPAHASARNIPFVTTNMVVNTIPGDLFQEQFYFLDAERNPDQDPPEPTSGKPTLAIFDPVNSLAVHR